MCFNDRAGNATLGSSRSNSLTVNAKLQGATPLVFEGVIQKFVSDKPHCRRADRNTHNHAARCLRRGDVVLTSQPNVITGSMILDGTIGGADLNPALSIKTNGSISAGSVSASGVLDAKAGIDVIGKFLFDVSV